MAAAGFLDLGLGLGAADPRSALDTRPGLEILVHLEEVLDLQLVELGDVPDVLQVRQPGIAGRYAEHLVVAALLVPHPEHADRPAQDQAAGKRGFLDEYEGVEWITVLPEGVLDEAVVGRVLRRGEERPVEPDSAGIMIHFVLVAMPFRDLDRDVEMHVV